MLEEYMAWWSAMYWNTVQPFQASFLNSELPSLKVSSLREERCCKVPVRLQPEADMWDTYLASIRIRNKSSTLPFSWHFLTSRDCGECHHYDLKFRGRRRKKKLVPGERLFLHSHPEKKQTCFKKSPKNLQNFQSWKQLPLPLNSDVHAEHLWIGRQKRDTSFLMRNGMSLRDSGVTEWLIFLSHETDSNQTRKEWQQCGNTNSQN